MILYLFFTGSEKNEYQIGCELIQLVRELIGPIAAFRLSAAVIALPRTRSGKTTRKSIADLARNKKIKVTLFINVKILDLKIVAYVQKNFTCLFYLHMVNNRCFSSYSISLFVIYF